MDYNKFMKMIKDFGDSEKALGRSSLSDYDEKCADMLEKYGKICEIAVKLDFSKI